MPSPVRPLALTMGDPAGIGGEITLNAWRQRRERGLPPFVVLDDPARLAACAVACGWEVPLRVVTRVTEAEAIFADALPVLPVPLLDPVVPGQPDPCHAPAVLASIDRAVDLVREGTAAALVTNPIHKATLYRAGFRYPGHTEYLAYRAGDGAIPVMMLACDGLRVVPVTVHVALRQAIARLSTASIIQAGHILAAALVRDCAIARPRIAVAALNPHAGEDGTMGQEEATLIEPAITALRAAGIETSGPHAADTLFHAAARQRYDAALCMYHDQALIPLKTLAFDEGVNVTLGLPFVRTSPDHGTAFDIAGRGIASPNSLIAALRLAATMATARQHYQHQHHQHQHHQRHQPHPDAPGAMANSTGSTPTP